MTTFYKFQELSWHRIQGVFLRYFYNFIKGPFQLCDLLYWPLIDILLWGITSIWIQQTHTSSDIVLVIMTALVFWQICWRGSIDIGIPLLTEFWSRNLINLFSSPLKMKEWIFGVLLVSLCKLCVTISFGAVIILCLYSMNIFSIGWAFLPFATLLLIFGWTMGFLASSGIIYWGQKLEVVAFMFGYVFAPFSAVFYPVSILPLWAQKISWCLPTTYIFEGMRALLYEQTFYWSYFGISLLLSFTYLFLSIALFNFSFKKSQKKGLARHE